MPAASFTTKVGSTSDVRASKADVVLVHEPETGALLRTKGRLYLLIEIAGTGSASTGSQIAREIADLVKQEYYYDLSAGIEIALRKALRQANRRAAQRLKEQRTSVSLHLACAVVVNNEIYGAHVGGAQAFLVRRARLFIPGDEPGELADFVHRATTRDAAALGAEPDVMPKVWRQPIEAGDTLLIASGALIDGLGAETLKGAAVTLHPRAAAEHIHNRAIADGVTGSDGAIFVELTQSSGAAARVAPETVPLRPPEEVVIAESIRARLDWLSRFRPWLTHFLRGATTPVASAATKTVGVGLELMPRKAGALPKRTDTARQRSRRQRRAVTTLAILLLLAATGVGALAYRDYESGSASRDYANVLATAQDSLASAHRLAERKPPDPDGARTKIAQARAKIAEAAKYPAANHEQLDALTADADTLTDRLDGVILDLARIAPGARPTQIIGNTNGLYVADPGSGRLWRIFGEPMQTGVVMQKGQKGVGGPTRVSWQDQVLYALDDARHVLRAEGDQVKDVTPQNAGWKSADAIAVFTLNLYVLDSASGQLWKHESSDGVSFGAAAAYLDKPIAANAAKSLAVDGDVWIVTNTSEILRYRRNPLVTTASRVDFTPRWSGDAPHPTAIQAVQGQTNIYVLDSVGRTVIQMSRDGRELLRITLPTTLEEASAFYVSEAARVAYTVHGSKVVQTALDKQ